MGLILVPGFIFGVLCGAVLLIQIHVRTRGSALIVAIWHGLFNLLTASKVRPDINPIIMSALVVLGGLLITTLDRSRNSLRAERRVFYHQDTDRR
jgi:hypothetical protein